MTSAQASTRQGSAVAAAPAEVPALDGLWKGQLKVPGGQLEVIFRFVKLSGGEYFCSLDVPLQKVSRMAVKTEIKSDTVRLFAEEANSRFVGTVSKDAKQMTGVWQQPGFKVPMVLTFSALPDMAAKNVRLTPPYREEEATFSNLTVNARLSGMLTIPAGPGPFPAVVLLSDAGPHDRNGTVGDFGPLGLLADYLTRRGVAVLRFDDRGVGKSAGTPAATTADLVSDAQAGLNYLRTRPEIDLAHLGLVGHGEGGNVALLAAAQPLPPAFVVAMAAYGLPGRDIVVQQQATTLRTLGTENAQIEAATKRQPGHARNHPPDHRQLAGPGHCGQHAEAEQRGHRQRDGPVKRGRDDIDPLPLFPGLQSHRETGAGTLPRAAAQRHGRPHHQRRSQPESPAKGPGPEQERNRQKAGRREPPLPARARQVAHRERPAPAQLLARSRGHHP
ncbi:serine aminopeptidase domain-containing protein [Hymenobacter humi]|uniref:Serine aminopeptidase domain-containing protein n=1 Tax=Hymenobacter humi TaxID=1411620 RepID=A0ABW2U1L7_9BACT